MRIALRTHARVTFAALALVLAALPALAQQAPLTELQFDIVGVRLVVDPPALTVPKNIATQINTSLVLPDGAGAAATEAIARLSRGAVVEAQLRGPEIPPTTVRVAPGQPIPLPAFALPGDYVLDGIRLVKDGVPLLDAQTADGRPATTIPIAVIGEILVSSVTSRPLSLDEIRERGIVIDETSFRTVNFQLALDIDGHPFNIDLPAALPTADLLKTMPRERAIVELAAVNRQIQATLAALPPQLDRPGLNFSIAPLPFFVELHEDEEPPFEIPPITGLIVIPGNVAFLNQFFSVMLMVSNVAPEATPLVVRNVRATIALPTGLDRIAGTYEAPGDDPLRLARVEGAGAQPTIEVRQAGPDGEFGTADDFDYLAPQQVGRGEFLVEGLREGGHGFDIRIRGTLEGLPSGPVEVEGVAAGAVFVRNPSFAVSLAHPRTVRAGESYDLYATITNTSQSVANLTTVSLDPFAIFGAELLSDPQVRFETIRSGESMVARFRLRSQRTGEVIFSSFTGDVAGDIRLTAGVDERGVPLAPNAIVLPRVVDHLPAALVLAAQRVLGQALSIATAPAAALPPGVAFVSKATVTARGRSLAEAGQRVQFGGAGELTPAVSDLLLDWLGERQPDDGFDQIVRGTEAGRDFLAEVAAILGPSFIPDPLGAQHAFAQATVARGAQVTVSGGPAGGGGPPLAVSVTREDGAVADASGNALPTSGVLRFGSPAASAFIAVVRPDATRYTVEGRAAGDGTFDLGVVVPGASSGASLQLRFAGVALQPGGTIRVRVDLSASGAAQALVDRDGDGTVDATLDPAVVSIVEGPPHVVDVVTLEAGYADSPGSLGDAATYGLLLGVLFDKPVKKGSAETLSNYALEGGNAVLGAQLQPSGRLVYLYLRKPVGALVARTLALAGIADERGTALAPVTRSIRSNLTDGVRLFGQAREADGTPVPGALITIEKPLVFTIARIRAESDGSFEVDYIPLALQDFRLTAQHPRTAETVTLGARMRGAGDRMLLNPTFLGRGTVRGRILAPDGVTPIAGAEVGLIPGQVRSSRGALTRANALGEYVFTGVEAGAFTLNARDATGLTGRITGVIARAGDEVTLDLILVERPEDGGRVGGRVFLSDGITPAAGFPVYIGEYNRNRARIAAIDQTVTDGTGSFMFPTVIPEGSRQVVAVDVATGQVGVVAASVLARTTTTVAIVMEATGEVQGVVFDASGRPVAGAVVAGGIALAETDVNGAFHITGVPAGRSTIEAGDPVTRKRGSAVVQVLPGEVVTAAITLEARATIRGRVLDAAGNPVPFASVRIPQLGGYTFVIANSQGVYTFPDLPLGEYLVQAPGPSKEALIAYMEFNGIDPASAFTSGDGPASPPPLSSEDAQAVIAAYQQAVQNFLSVDESLVTPPPMAALGGFGYSKAKLWQDASVVVRDIRFLPQGHVAGVTQDANGLPTGALVRIRGLKVGLTGQPLFFELERGNSDAQTGAFRFDNVPRFDLETFQTAGVRGGDFQVQAATPFSPALAEAFGQLNTATPDVDGLVVRFPAAAETNGTISGVVVMPDGVTPAPQGTQVRISFGDLTVTTRADGTFQSLLPIPASRYTLTAQTAAGGLRGEATAVVTGGANVHVPIRLLGLGTVNVQVQRPGGAFVTGAPVVLQRATFPSEKLQGITDGQGRVRFVNVSEGQFSVEAVEPGTGLTGRASGRVVRDTEIASVVTIAASGRVTGTFLTADGLRTIPFAQISLSAGGVQAYASTDAAGRFELTAIPVGAFSVEAFDPASNRRGRASGQLVAEGQTVDVSILQLPRGAVTGFVVNADGVTRVGGASVRLRTGGFVATDLLATSRPDGSFRFEGIPQGAFTLEAEDSASGAKGEAGGRISLEGEELSLNVTLEPFGTILVTVHDHTGALATNASVGVTGGGLKTPRSGSTDTGGQVRFENLPLGKYVFVGRLLADERDAGRVAADVTSANELVEVTLTLRGVGSVTVEVTDAAGAPAPSARVTVSARGGFGEDGPARGPSVGFTDGAGRVTFPSVPVGDFTVLAELGPLAGAAGGSVGSPGQPVPVAVQLAPSGSVTGRILLPGGTTPAFQALVTVYFQSQTAQAGALQLTTGLDGRFSFTGLPLGDVRLDAFELVSQGVGQRAGALASLGQILDFGDVVLDNESPRVAGVNPADGAANVAANASIVVTFTEPMDALSFTDANTRLLLGSTPVETTRGVSADGRTVTIAPKSPLLGGVRYVLAIAGSPGGPKDESNLSLVDPFISAFTVRDNVAPTIVSTSPAAGGVQVLPEAVVRVSFSEPVATATIELRDAGGQPVPGTASLAVGNSVAVFAPQDFLRANTTYTFIVSGVVDLAGNPLAGGVFTASFATVDTIAPLIQALHLTGTPRAGGTVTLEPTIAGADTVRVEYAVALGGTAVASAAPFAAALTLPTGVTETTVTAVAIDGFGNRSPSFTLPVTLEQNNPPAVQLVNVAGLTAVSQGQAADFDVVVTDDEAVGQVVFTASGVTAFSETRTVPGAPAATTQRFRVMVPATAPATGQLLLSAAAIDTAGNRSATASLALPVSDGIGPTVTIVSPAASTALVPGEAFTLIVDASGEGGLATLAMTCVPALAGCESRQLSGTSTREIFTIQVPASVQPPTQVSIAITVSDTRGNPGSAGRVFTLADRVAPVVTALSPVSGSTRVLPGETVAVSATATDAVGVTSVLFTATSGAFTTSQAVAVTGTSATATFSFGAPADLAPGAQVLVTAVARDAAGNESAPANLTLEVGDSVPPTVTIAPETGLLEMVPGQPVRLIATAHDEIGVTRITISGTGAFTFSDAKAISPALAQAQAIFTVNVPAWVQDGQTLTVTARAVDLSGNTSVPTTLTLTARIVSDVTLPASSLLLAGDVSPTPVQIPAVAPAGGVRIDLASGNAGVATVPPFVSVPEGAASATFEITGVAGGTTTVEARIDGVPRASMTVTVRGGVVRGRVVDETFTPVAGVHVTAIGSATGVTDTLADGTFLVEGVLAGAGQTITVRAFDEGSGRLGVATGAYGVANGAVTLADIVLLEAGSITGTVVQADVAGTPAGAGVRVDLFRAGGSQPGELLATTFTDADSRFAFDIVSLGTYVLEASDVAGNRGRLATGIGSSGATTDVTVRYLGRGAVLGTVRTAGGAPVPNASLTLSMSSLFGTAARTGTAAADGTFRFDGVFIGTFTLQAADPISHAIGGVSGAVALHQEEVTADVSLTPFSNLRGTVFRADGVTTVGAGVSVTLNRCDGSTAAGCVLATVTDEQGQYRYDFVPLANEAIVIARDAVTRGVGRGAIPLNVNGATPTLDITFQPQATLVVLVTDANAMPQASADVTVSATGTGVTDQLTAITGADGTVVVERVLAGSVVVSASAGGLSGSARATLSAGDVKNVTVVLQPTATITGRVHLPNGQSPAVDGRVVVTRQTAPFTEVSIVLTPEADGLYRVEGLPLAGYLVRVFDAAGQLRGIARNVVLASNNEVVTRDFTLVGLGTVSGRVVNPDGSAASGIAVVVTSFVPEFGSSRTVTADGGGHYVVERVPVGGVLATAQTAQLIGEARGQLTVDGQTLTLDILLESNIVTLPATLADGNGSNYIVAGSGRLEGGFFSVFNGTNAANRGSANLVITRDGAPEAFAGSAFGTYEGQRREIAIRQDALQGLSVVRKVFVPATGYFTRHLELLTNPTAMDITVDVQVVSNYRAAYCCSVELAATGSGDRAVTAADRWVVLDDFTDADPQDVFNAPPVAYVLSGAGALMAPQDIAYQDFGNRVAQLAITWQQVTIPAGQTVGLMHFTAQQVNKAGAIATAQRLETLPPEALDGLSAGEIAAIRNFVVPADGVGTVEPLPVLTGTVSGTVFEGDGTTPVQDATLNLVSSSPYFGRRREFTSTTGGAFSVTGLAGGALPIPVAPFTITATHPGSGNAGPAIPGAFAEGTTSATVDVLFTNLGRIEGTVRRANGVLAPDVRVVMQTTTGTYVGERATDASGVFRFAGVAPDTVVLTGDQIHAHGTGIATPPTQVQVLAGQRATPALTLEQDGSLLITVVDANGVAVPNAYVVWERDNAPFIRSAYTDATGRIESSFMPVGTFTLRAYDPTGNVPARTTFSIAFGQQTSVNVQLLRLGTVTVTVLRTNGQPAANMPVHLFDSDVSRSATTNVNGNAVLTDVPFDRALTLLATHRQYYKVRTETTFTLTAATSSATVTLPPYGQIGGTATLANGGLILNRCVVSLAGTDYSLGLCTNASGAFSADGVPVGVPVTVRVNHPTVPGLFKNTVVTLPEDGAVVSRAFATAAQGTARLTVLQGDGTALAGVRVETRTTTSPTSFTFRGTTNASGVIDLASIPEGVFTVRIRNASNTLTLGERDFEFLAAGDGQTVPYTYQVQSFVGSVSGALFLEDGTTPAQTPIVVQAMAANGSVVASSSASNGAYTLSNLRQPEGGLRLVATWERDGEIRSAEQTVTFSAGGEAVTRDFTLPLVIGTVRGRVTAAADGVPVAGAAVSLATEAYSPIASPQLTDADGRYAFSDVVMARTRFRVTLTMNGVVSGQIVVTDRVLDESRSAVVDFVVDGHVVRLTGTVTASDLVTPISYAPVYVQVPCAVRPESCSEGQTHFTTASRSTNAAGVFEFPLVAVTAGARLQVRSPSRYDNMLVVPLAADATNSTKVVDVTFPISVVTGVVSFDGGAPVPNPNLFAVTSAGTTYTTYKDATGRYRLYDVPVGPMTLMAQDYDSGLTRTVEATVTEADQVLALDLTMPPSTTVEVSAIGPDGTAVAEFCAGLGSAGLAFSRTTCETTGTAIFENVPLGPIHVQVQYYDSTKGRYQYASMVADVTAAPSPFTLAVDYRAPSRAALDLTVLDPAGTPVADAYVALLPFGSDGPLGSDSYYVATGAGGTVSFTDLPPGPFRAQVDRWDPASGESVYAVVSGVLQPGQTTTATARLGTAISDDFALVGDDQFAYGLDFGRAAIVDWANPNGVPAVFHRAMQASDGDTSFGGASYAEADAGRRLLTIGPSFDEGILFTRRVFSPPSGGFVRFHDEITNALPYERTLVVWLRHDMEDDGAFTLDSTASPTTLTFVSSESPTMAVAGFVLGGAGAPVRAGGFDLPDASHADSDARYAYVVKLPAFGTIGLLHFAAQRAPEDLAALQQQLRALADLSDPNALAGLTAPQRAAIRNFVIP